MLDAFKRKRRLLWTAAAGAAGTAAVYYWWQWWQEAQLLKAERSSVANMAVSDLLRVTSPQLDEFTPALDEEASAEVAEDLDTSMDSHFCYIQDISTPQELEQLLPCIQALLFEMTDTSRVRSMQMPAVAQSQPVVHVTAASSALAGSVHGVIGGSDGQHVSSQQQQPVASLNSKDVLHRLAMLSFARSASACYLIPLVDLYVRVKLNLIGRHMFLQEKLVKLKQPVHLNGCVHVPPRLTASAVETFLKCSHFSGQGSRWLIDKVMSVTSEVLSEYSLESTVGIIELTQLLRRVLSAVEVACTSSWPDILMGDGTSEHGMETHAAMTGSADQYRRAIASNAMVDELQGELRLVLTSYRFREALRAAVQHCFRAVTAQLHAGLLSTSSNSSGTPAAATGAASASTVGGSAGARNEVSGASSGAAASSSHTQQVEGSYGAPPGAGGRGVLPRLDEDAERSGVGDGTVAGNGIANPSGSSSGGGISDATKFTHANSSDPALFSGFPPDTLSGRTSISSAAATSAAAAGGTDQQPDPPDTPTGSASQLLRDRRRASTDGLNLSTSHGKDGSQKRGGLHGVGSASTSCMHMHPPGLQALLIPPRQLARALRPVQLACDPLFKSPRSVTKGIAGLHSVTALCATAFACTPAQL